MIELRGVVREILPQQKALVDFPDGRCINVEISARITVRFTRLQAGDRVRCEMSPFDSTKVRIVERIQGGE